MSSQLALSMFVIIVLTIGFAFAVDIVRISR